LTLEPLVSNASVEPTDIAELWPTPADRVSGSLTTTVMAVEKGAEGDEIRFVGTPQEGLNEERLADVFHRGVFVGTASISGLGDPLSRARMIQSATRTKPEVGDEVRIRPPAPAGAPRLAVRAVVFNIQSDVCLIAAGEVDGLRVGDKFVVRD